MTGHRGFHYHFLDMTTGERANLYELSTVDSSFLLGGMLAAAAYFDEDSEAEQEVLRACPYVATGLRRAGFTSGWL